MKRITDRIARLECRNNPVSLFTPQPPMSDGDGAFLEQMIARSLAGDRDWSPAEEAKYHDLLLGEYIPPPNFEGADNA